MKKILIYALVALGMTFTLSSCEKMFGNFLDKEPSNQLTEEQVFSNWALMEYYHFNTYSFIPNGFGRIRNSRVSTLGTTTQLPELPNLPIYGMIATKQSASAIQPSRKLTQFLRLQT